MKNKFIYLTVVLFTAFAVTSCASRKYGCPNSTGMKTHTITAIQTAA